MMRGCLQQTTHLHTPGVPANIPEPRGQPRFTPDLYEVPIKLKTAVVFIRILVTLVSLGVGERPLGGKLRGETVLLGESTDREKDGDGERLERREAGKHLGRTAGMPNSASISPDASRGFFMRGIMSGGFIRYPGEVTTEAQRRR